MLKKSPLQLHRLDDRIVPAASTLVYAGIDGHLLSTPDDRGDRIPDFANVGYKSGVSPIPTAPVKATVSPGTGDDTAAIQAAINTVAALPLDANGLRGAVLLTAGEYQIGTFLTINASGVVLRGVGDGTVLRATGTSTRAIVQVAGSGSRSTVVNTTYAITDKYVPVGARSFHVDSTSGLAVGHTVTINRPSTQNWINDLDMDQLAMPWTPGSKDLNFDRVITRIEGNLITLDAPLTCALDATYGGGTIKRYTWAGRIENVGIESLKGISDYVSSTDEAHSWDLITMNALQNGWVRNVTSMYFAYSLVSLSDVKWVTVENCNCLDPISEITGGRRYSFNVNGQLNLIRDCYARNGRHDFVNGALVEGPNVFVDCRADSAKSDTGPHHRWSVGTLFDNVNVQGNQINVQNRGNSGTGHGWAGANMVIWNSTASGGFIVQNPPTAQNWLIGGIGTLKTGTMFVGPTPQVGIVESLGTNVDLKSLYYAQLQERLRVPGLSVREYPLGDEDGFVYDGSSDNLPVDPAWNTAVDAITTLPLVGSDIGTTKTFVPFTFNFSLAANERVVGASLSLGLRATGANFTTDSIRIDSVSNAKTFTSLGWTSLSTTATTGKVLDLNDQLALLQDGKLNLAIGDDTGVDWATLYLQVAPKDVVSQDPLTPATLAPVADATVRGGASANINFGSDTSLSTKLDSSADVLREAFLQFDLTGVTGTVIGAQLRFTPSSVGGTVENALSIVSTDSWSETGITWNTRPAALRRVATWTPVVNQTVEVALTPWVQETLAGDKVLSVKLSSLSNIGGPGLVSYYSREASAFRPELVLTLATPVGYVVNGGAVQHSRITTVDLTFASPVNAATLAALGGIRLTRGATVVQTGATGTNGRIIVSPATGTVSSMTLTFDGSIGVENHSLADGRWQLSIPSLGYTSTLNSIALRRLFGDNDNNGTVDATDFAAMGASFGKSSTAFDWDDNGTVDAVDLAAFGNRFGVTL